MKTETGLKRENRQGPNRLLNIFSGLLLGIVILAGVAAGLKISQEPRSLGPMSRNDLELFDHDNGDGTYTTQTQTNAYARFGSIDWHPLAYAGTPPGSNVISMTNQEYYFQASNDVLITGIIDKSAQTNTAPPVVLTIDNTNTSGVITCRWAAAMMTIDGLDFLPITNGTEGIISIRYNARAGKTNVVARMFYN